MIASYRDLISINPPSLLTSISQPANDTSSVIYKGFMICQPVEVCVTPQNKGRESKGLRQIISVKINVSTEAEASKRFVTNTTSSYEKIHVVIRRLKDC